MLSSYFKFIQQNKKHFLLAAILFLMIAVPIINKDFVVSLLLSLFCFAIITVSLYYLKLWKETEIKFSKKPLLERIPSHVRIVVGSVLFFLLFPITFEGSQATTNYYNYLLAPFLGNLLITPIFTYIIKLIDKRPLSMKHVIIAIVIRSGMVLLVSMSTPELMLINVTTLLYSMTTVYATFKAYLSDDKV